MRPVRREELLPLDAYERARAEIRPAMIEAKGRRRVHLGPHLTFLFENTATIRYQVQEMVRAERLTDEAAVRHELDTYNELLGARGELGATLLIEIAAPPERDLKLREWMGLPEHLYLALEDGTRVRAKFDARQVGEDRLSSVQYLKFDVQGRTPVRVGCDHRALTIEEPIPAEARAALAEDLRSDA